MTMWKLAGTSGFLLFSSFCFARNDTSDQSTQNDEIMDGLGQRVREVRVATQAFITWQDVADSSTEASSRVAGVDDPRPGKSPVEQSQVEARVQSVAAKLEQSKILLRAAGFSPGLLAQFQIDEFRSIVLWPRLGGDQAAPIVMDVVAKVDNQVSSFGDAAQEIASVEKDLSKDPDIPRGTLDSINFGRQMHVDEIEAVLALDRTQDNKRVRLLGNKLKQVISNKFDPSHDISADMTAESLRAAETSTTRKQLAQKMACILQAIDLQVFVAKAQFERELSGYYDRRLATEELGDATPGHQMSGIQRRLILAKLDSIDEEMDTSWVQLALEYEQRRNKDLSQWRDDLKTYTDQQIARLSTWVEALVSYVQ